MPDERADDILHQPEADGPHENHEAAFRAIDSRLLPVLAHEKIGGLPGIREALSSAEDETEQEEYLLRILGVAYSTGWKEDRLFMAGQLDSPELRTIDFYEEALNDQAPPEQAPPS